MKEGFKNKKVEITIIFIISVVVILFFSGYSLGKGFNRKDINGKAEIAKPILEIESGNNLEINNTNEKGIYEFKVKNYNEQGEKTDVDLEYYIEILDNLANSGIELKLFKDEKEVEIKENKTENFILTKNEMREDNYKLEVTYDKSKNINMEDIIKQLQIKVHSEQKQEVQWKT